MSGKGWFRRAAESVLPAPSAEAEGDFVWAFALLSEDGRTRLFETFEAIYGPRKDALVVDLLTRWMRTPFAAGLLSWPVPLDAPAVDMGRATPIIVQGYRRTWELLHKRAQRECHGDLELAMQLSLNEQATLMGFNG